MTTTPQHFVNRLNESEMPKVGYQKAFGRWLWPAWSNRYEPAIKFFGSPDGAHEFLMLGEWKAEKPPMPIFEKIQAEIKKDNARVAAEWDDYIKKYGADGNTPEAIALAGKQGARAKSILCRQP